MSSILEALKKLESEKAKSARSAGRVFETLPPEQQLTGRKPSRGRSLKPIALVGFGAFGAVLLVTVSVGVSLFFVTGAAKVEQVASVPAAAAPLVAPPVVEEKPETSDAVASGEDGRAGARPHLVARASRPWSSQADGRAGARPHLVARASRPWSSQADGRAGARPHLEEESAPVAEVKAAAEPVETKPATDPVAEAKAASEPKPAAEPKPEPESVAEVKPAAEPKAAPVAMPAVPAEPTPPPVVVARATPAPSPVPVAPPRLARGPVNVNVLPPLRNSDKALYGLEGVQLNMLRPASKNRPYASAIINLQPVEIGEVIPGSSAVLIAVEMDAVAIEIQDTGERFQIRF